MAWVAGVDGCKAGWIAAACEVGLQSPPRFELIPEFEDIKGVFGVELSLIAVDIPIGLVDDGHRLVEPEARRLLGRRHVCVYTPPERPILEFATHGCHLTSDRPGTYRESYRAVNRWTWQRLGHGVAAQAFAIYPKIAEVDHYMRVTHDERVFEVHPELCFRAMNGGEAVPSGKKTGSGQRIRRELLERWFGHSLDEPPPKRLIGITWSTDDLHDALAALWTAVRIQQGQARRIPRVPEADSCGLDMAMWF